MAPCPWIEHISNHQTDVSSKNLYSHSRNSHTSKRVRAQNQHKLHAAYKFPHPILLLALCCIYNAWVIYKYCVPIVHQKYIAGGERYLGQVRAKVPNVKKNLGSIITNLNPATNMLYCIFSHVFHFFWPKSKFFTHLSLSQRKDSTIGTFKAGRSSQTQLAACIAISLYNMDLGVHTVTILWQMLMIT